MSFLAWGFFCKEAVLTSDCPSPSERLSFFTILRVFLKLGLTSFGGTIAHLGCFQNELLGDANGSTAKPSRILWRFVRCCPISPAARSAPRLDYRAAGFWVLVPRGLAFRCRFSRIYERA